MQYLTRAVRIIDLITNVNSQAFQTLDGMNVFINRLAVWCFICGTLWILFYELQHEVDLCRKEEPHQVELPKRQTSVFLDNPSSPARITSTETMHVEPVALEPSTTPSEVANQNEAPVQAAPIIRTVEPVSVISQLIEYPAVQTSRQLEELWNTIF